MIIKNGLLLNSDFQWAEEDIEFDNGIITKIEKNLSGDEIIDAEGGYITPGFIDIHTHGAVGFDALDPSFEAINKMSVYQKKKGVTTFLPTITTQSFENLQKAALNIKSCMDKGTDGSKIGGIYAEGPYFSVKRKGAQNEDYIKNPDPEEFTHLYESCGGIIKIVSMAPEKDGAEKFIKEISGKAAVFMGHTDADYETAKKAIDWGISGMTHTFNAMRSLHHREPGAVGAALISNIKLELISDGMHINPAIVKLAYNAAGRDRLVLISDSIRAAGMEDGEYELGGQEVFVKDGKATLADGTIAGGTTHLADCVRRAVSFGIPFEDAVKCASINPAEAAGIDKEVGSLEVGKKADILIFDKKLELKKVIVNGK